MSPAKVSPALAVHTWLRSTLADRTEVDRYHHQAWPFGLELDRLVYDAAKALDVDIDLVAQVWKANSAPLCHLWTETVAAVDLTGDRQVELFELDDGGA